VAEAANQYVHDVAIVIPVYQGERTLDALVDELVPLTHVGRTPSGRFFEVVEIVLVHDRGPDNSDQVIRRLSRAHQQVVRPLWLSRNYGQHAATMAGMASTSASWIVTMDEDGQHDPADISRLLDTALDQQVPLVYARSTNPPPHGRLRNSSSRTAKWLATKVLVSGDLGDYSSFRLVVGEVGRSVAAYSGHGTYLDVAFSWVVSSSATCAVRLREEGDRRSGYRWRSLASHFWRLVLTSGTRPLRVVSLLGVVLSLGGLAYAAYVIVMRLRSDVQVQGWASVIVAVLLANGVVLFSLGVISEYVGVAVRMAMGRPAYLILSDPLNGPLGHPDVAAVDGGWQAAGDQAEAVSSKP
jgi:glycosyltransferase involved in cell wall biosynthesis